MTTDEQVASILFKVDHILEILQRIEARQIKTTAMVEEVKEHEGPTEGFTGLYQKQE